MVIKGWRVVVLGTCERGDDGGFDFVEGDEWYKAGVEGLEG